MDTFYELLNNSGFSYLGWGNWVMFAIAGVLIYLAIKKEYEPLLLIPIGFGIILANLPLAQMGSYNEGIIALIYDGGIKTELLPPLIFLGVGVLTDFRPLLSQPITFLLGAAAQLGIFVAAMCAAYIFGFTFSEAASIGIIGGADGPTSIFLSSKLAPHLLGPIAIAAYSYMSLVPIIQPPVMKLLTTKHERAISMPALRSVSKTAVILFPLITGIVSSLAIPSCAPLMGMLMFGNLLRESGVTERLRKTAGSALIDIVTIFLGLAVGATMSSGNFLNWQTLG
ncbi:MAG: sodium ion-translocating decarboxylase subunit beta, partial [Bacteroidota bacterium]